jgi:hypothetical protein
VVKILSAASEVLKKQRTLKATSVSHSVRHLNAAVT